MSQRGAAFGTSGWYPDWKGSLLVGSSKFAYQALLLDMAMKHGSKKKSW